jgi:hypothetical protein
VAALDKDSRGVCVHIGVSSPLRERGVLLAEVRVGTEGHLPTKEKEELLRKWRGREWEAAE